MRKWPRSDSSPGTGSASTWTLELPASRIVRNKCLCLTPQEMTAYKKAVDEELSSPCSVQASIPPIGSWEDSGLDAFTVPVQVWVIFLLMGPGHSGGAIPGHVLKHVSPLLWGTELRGREPHSTWAYWR